MDDTFATENLILLEFLVDSVNFDADITDNLVGIKGETCVSFQFLDNAPLHVCEEDFSPKRKYDKDTGSLKNGKSCLFSLTPQQAQDCRNKFDVFVTVFKKMEPGVLPDKMQIGETLISIANLFNDLISSLGKRTEDCSPAAKTLKDCFKISKASGEVIGDIKVYIRISCFGKLIVTQFQMNLEDKSVQFKAKEGHYLFKYNKLKKDEVDIKNNKNMLKSINTNCPAIPCNQIVQETEENFPCQICNNVPYDKPQQKYITDNYTQPLQTDYDPQQCFQEIGAQMGGNALTIRVHKNKNKIEEFDSTEEGCACSVGKSRNQNDMGNPCPGGFKQNLNINPGLQVKNQKVPLEFKMAGCGKVTENNITATPPALTNSNGNQVADPLETNRDVFILRIGKKNEGITKKSNLELELCTPKGIDMKPVPKRETRDTQYDLNDVNIGGKKSKDEKKGKAGKGKAGKGGKKGKKGKKK